MCATAGPAGEEDTAAGAQLQVSRCALDLPEEWADVTPEADSQDKCMMPLRSQGEGWRADEKSFPRAEEWWHMARDQGLVHAAPSN